MNSVIQKYGSGIFSFMFAVLTGLSALQFGQGNLTVSLQVIPIVVTGLVTWIIPLTKGKWAGGWKTGLDILSVIAVVLLPIVMGNPWPWSKAIWILVGISILKASATEFGVYIRVNETPTATNLVTNLPSAAIPNSGTAAVTDSTTPTQ
jgi:hypothetical protein